MYNHHHHPPPPPPHLVNPWTNRKELLIYTCRHFHPLSKEVKNVHCLSILCKRMAVNRLKRNTHGALSLKWWQINSSNSTIYYVLKGKPVWSTMIVSRSDNSVRKNWVWPWDSNITLRMVRRNQIYVYRHYLKNGTASHYIDNKLVL